MNDTSNGLLPAGGLSSIRMPGSSIRRLLIATVLFTSVVLIWGTAFDGRNYGPIPVVLDVLPHGDKVGHFILYGTIAFGLGSLVRRRDLVIAIGVGLVIAGIADEFRQLMEGNRNFTLSDIVANAVGIAVGLVIASALPSSFGTAAVPLIGDLARGTGSRYQHRSPCRQRNVEHGEARSAGRSGSTSQSSP